jgi:hypothetical protein
MDFAGISFLKETPKTSWKKSSRRSAVTAEHSNPNSLENPVVAGAPDPSIAGRILQSGRREELE